MTGFSVNSSYSVWIAGFLWRDEFEVHFLSQGERGSINVPSLSIPDVLWKKKVRSRVSSPKGRGVAGVDPPCG